MKILSIVLLLILNISVYSQYIKLDSEPKHDTYGTKDWLLDRTLFESGVYKMKKENEIVITNGLLRRVFVIADNAATVSFDNLATNESIIRGIKPEAEIEINGIHYDVGGLIGQPNYAYLNPEWIDKLKSDSTSFQFVDFEVSKPIIPFEWKRIRHNAKDSKWPPKGVHLRMNYRMPEAKEMSNSEKSLTSDVGSEKFDKKGALVGKDIIISVHYELYDGLPVIVKWISVQNNSVENITIDSFTSEIIAAVEYMSPVEQRGIEIPKPNIHIETDYAFSGMTTQNSNNHVVHWEIDPDYHTQVNYLRLTPCLLKVKPEIGPNKTVKPSETFQSFRTFVLPFDSYDRERQGLAQRKMYRMLAPWTSENPLMMHARFADWERVKTAIDQCAEVGFEMVILTFGSGFNIENDSQEYLSEMRMYSEYAKSKGIEIGGYSLLASRKVGNRNDVVMPKGKKPTFGNSPCIGSEWGQDYFSKLYNFYEKTGFFLLEHDGSYPGDVCISEDHPGHSGYEDSRWNQYKVISDFYKWCRSNGIYLNVPDYYYMTGSNKCAMGYREVNWSLPREQQLIHTRQNIYDGTWTKTPSMGWMFVPLTEYHGGGTAATIEPLNEHLDHYEMMMMGNLGGGVQACYRGPRLFDTDVTKSMVKKQIDWYKKHREVLEGDIIHLRRADGRDIDYWLNVNPGGNEKGMLVVFNPLKYTVTKNIKIPLYYTGLKDKVEAMIEDGEPKVYVLDRDYNVEIKVTVKGENYTWITLK